MARTIIKKIGGDRIGSGNQMTVRTHGYGYSTHDVSKVRRTSISFGTIVPMGMWLLTSGSHLKLRLDALITSNALNYQLYGTAKFQADVFETRMANYNPKMLLNLNDQGYNISDIKFPKMRLQTNAITSNVRMNNQQINDSALLRYLGVNANGQNTDTIYDPVTRDHMAMWLLMYYQTVKEYYCNKQEKVGYMIHMSAPTETVTYVALMKGAAANTINKYGAGAAAAKPLEYGDSIRIKYVGAKPTPEDIVIIFSQPIASFDNRATIPFAELFNEITYEVIATETYMIGRGVKPRGNPIINWWNYTEVTSAVPKLAPWDLKAVDRMMMKIMSDVENPTALIIDQATELPYGASFKTVNNVRAINTTQEGICLGTYQSDVFNNWLDNETIDSLNAKSKIKVNEDGEFSINDLNLTQKLYNINMRIGITDGTLDEWREMTYGQASKNRSLKPVYAGGLSKEILFDMVISTAGTTTEPLGSIASRGTFGSKHKGGYAEISADEEKLVMVLAKITPRLVYNQGNDWTTDLISLEDLHKPALDKIGYQNLLTDTIAAWETGVTDTLIKTYHTAGKQPAWQWYRTNYDDALGNMAGTENYKVFGREYDGIQDGDGYWRIKDLTTYIDPMKFNDVFADKSLGAMNFDLQMGMEATLNIIMSEEVIPNM